MRTLLLFTLLLPTLASAQIYRWTDAEGRVHFGQRPAAGAEQIEVRPQVVERDDQTREREARSERFFDARRQEQQAAREQASQTWAAQEQECQSLRNRLSQLQLGGRFFMHIFTHRNSPYAFIDQGPSDWMSRHFFSGGIMPSTDLPSRSAGPSRSRGAAHRTVETSRICHGSAVGSAATVC